MSEEEQPKKPVSYPELIEKSNNELKAFDDEDTRLREVRRQARKKMNNTDKRIVKNLKNKDDEYILRTNLLTKYCMQLVDNYPTFDLTEMLKIVEEHEHDSDVFDKLIEYAKAHKPRTNTNVQPGIRPQQRPINRPNNGDNVNR